MKILWIEDEQHVLGLDQVAAKWELDCAVACDVAVSKLENNKYDLLIVDLILPITTGQKKDVPFKVNYATDLEKKYGGLWLIKRIRNEMKLQTPILVLTIVVGKDRERVEKELAGLIAEYLSKYDVLPSELCEKIEALIPR
jgi:DNA-binding response OmpR family regulator